MAEAGELAPWGRSKGWESIRDEEDKHEEAREQRARRKPSHGGQRFAPQATHSGHLEDL